MNRAAIKKTHQSLALANPLADVVASPKLNAAVGAVNKVQAKKARDQAKTKRSKAACERVLRVREVS